MDFKQRLNHIAIGIGLKASSARKRPDRVSGIITPQAIRRAQRDVKDWRTALQKAEHPELPRRALLMNIYDEVILDGHLNGQIIGRKSRAIGGGFTIYDKNGEPNQELTALLDKPWFYDLLGHLWDANLFGHSLVEVDGFEPLKGDQGGIQSVKLVNRKNVVPEHGLVLKNPTDTSGTEYRDSEFTPWLFETSKTDDFGQLNIIAAYVFYKRYCMASWSEFTEIYGIPPRIGKTDISDTKLVDQMTQELQEMGRSMVGVIDLNDSVEFLEIKGTQSTNVFKDLIHETNNEVSKVINGTVIGEASADGSRSKEEVGERTAALVSRDDRKELELLVANQVLPKLIAMGYPFDGCTWSLDDDVNMNSLFKNVAELLKYGDVDPEFITDKFGIPWTPKTQVQKEDPKQNAGFFLISPGSEVQLSATGASLDAFYGVVELADQNFNINEQIERAIQDIYDDPEGEEINQDLFNYYEEKLSKAVDLGYGSVNFEENPQKWNNKFSLQNNVALFSGLKAFHEQSDLAKVMRDQDGNIRSFKDYRKDALKINEKYRTNWLKAEWDITRRSSAMAAKWQDMWSNKDLLPYLQYVPSRSATPREEHKKFYGLTLPIDDAKWDNILPPNGWGCKCGVRQMSYVPDGAITEMPSGVPRTPGLTGNAGKTGQVFSDDHPYVPKLKSVRDQIEAKVRNRVFEKAQEMRQSRDLSLKMPNGKPLMLPKRGLKKTLQQPIEDFSRRQIQRRLILKLPELLESAVLYKTLPNLKLDKKPHAIQYHYLEVRVSGGKFYLTIEEVNGGFYQLYTIIDQKTMTHLMKEASSEN